MPVPRLLITICILFFVSIAEARSPTESEQRALSVAASAYGQNGRELLCGCQVVNGRVSGDCPVANTPITAARELTFVPVISMAEYGRRRTCWRHLGKKSRYRSPLRQRDEKEQASPNPIFVCDVTDKVFREMSGDPFNLIPVVAALAPVKGHRKAGFVKQGRTAEEGCGMEVDEPGNGYHFEPPAGSKGDIARIYLYFMDRYHLKVEPERVEVFRQWSRSDPVDDQERRFHDALMAQTKQCNPYVTGTNDKCW